MKGTPTVPIRSNAVMGDRRIVAVALVTSQELQLLGEGFSRAWPVDQTPCFEGLLQAIDEADRELRTAPEESRVER